MPFLCTSTGVNKALLYSTDNKNTNVVNNVLNEGSDTAQGSHYCVDLGNTDNSNFMNNYLNGARGIVVKATATNVKIVNNAMIGNVFSGGLLVAIDSRTNKDVYIQGSVVDSNATAVYGNYYSYIDYTEI